MDMFPLIKGLAVSASERPGEACAVIRLPFCNLRCPYCDSHELVLRPNSLETLSMDDVLKRLEALADSLDRVCVSGGEPTVHRGLPGLLRRLREAGFKTALETNATQPEVLGYLLEKGLVDEVAVDLKAPLEDEAYSRSAGVFVPAAIIARSIEVLLEGDARPLFSCTVVPSLLGEQDVYRLARQLRELLGGDTRGTGLALRPFDPSDPMEPALKTVAPLPDSALARMQAEVNRILDPASL